MADNNMLWYTYIIKSLKKNWYYVGSTNSLERRLKEHNNQKVPSTKAQAPFQLVYRTEWLTEKEARLYEQKIKRQRRLKESIIRTIIQK